MSTPLPPAESTDAGQLSAAVCRLPDLPLDLEQPHPWRVARRADRPPVHAGRIHPGQIQVSWSFFIFWLVVAQLMIPWHLRLLPMFIIVQKLRWVDTFAALIIPQCRYTARGVPMKQYLESIPSELLEAARMDGCSEFGAFWRVVLPMAKPGMAVFSIYTFMDVWNSFIWPLVATTSSAMRTLQVGLSTLQETYERKLRPPDERSDLCGHSHGNLLLPAKIFRSRHHCRGTQRIGLS